MDRALYELSSTEQIDLCVESMAVKDPLTASHCTRVADLAAELASALELAAETRRMLHTAALIHDVGKAAMPSSILTKPEPLDAVEWCVMRQHPAIGARLATKLGLPPVLCDIVLHHHEHYDGTGYPSALRGEEIPLCARILCVVDVYDALTNERCYRPAHDPDCSLTIMAEECGSVLDPHVFRTFESMMRQDFSAEKTAICDELPNHALDGPIPSNATSYPFLPATPAAQLSNLRRSHSKR